MTTAYYSADKEIQRIVTDKVHDGWQIDRRGRHWKLVAPNNRSIAIPKTPGDWRSAKNFAAALRRITETKE